MTREEIIRNLKYTMKKHRNDVVNTFDTNISVMCKDILDYLEKEPRWIPISEISPNDGEWAIFTNGTQISIERYKMDALDHFYPSGRWFELEDVVAWMPLPKPYKPQDKEEEESDG